MLRLKHDKEEKEMQSKKVNKKASKTLAIYRVTLCKKQACILELLKGGKRYG